MSETGTTVFFIWMVILTPISVGTMIIVSIWFVKQRRSDKMADRIDQIWAQHEIWGDAICRQLIDRQITRSMSPDMVRLAWGQPYQVIQTNESERWLYDSQKKNTPTTYVEFQRDQVFAYQGSPEQREFNLGPWTVIAILLGISFIACLVVFAVLFIARG